MYSGPLRGNFVRNTHSLLTWSCDLSSVYVEEGRQVSLIPTRMMSSNATEKLFRLLGSPSSPRLFTQSLEQHGHARQNKRQCPSETLNFGIDVANNLFPPQNYQRKVFFDRFCERLCSCSFSGQYTFTNDMPLSAKYIARIFFSFWLRNALDQLSEDFVTNASSLFAYPPLPAKKYRLTCNSFI